MRADPSSPSKLCNNYSRFGHVKPCCKNSTVCPLCAGPDAKAEHRCPNPPTPQEKISNQSSTGALPLPHAAPTFPKTIRQAIWTARLGLYFPPVPLTVRMQRQLPLLPPAAHLNLPSASCLHPTRTPWTPSQMKQDSLHSRPHPPPGLWSLLPHGPLSALSSWVPRGPPPAVVALPSWAAQPLPRFQRSVGLAPVNVSQLTSLPSGRPLSRYLSIVQHNSLGSWDVFLSLFNYFASAKCPPDIVCLQDPSFPAPAFLAFNITPRLPLQVGLATTPRWLFMFPLTYWLRPWFYLPFLTGLMWPPSTCSGLTCLGSHSLTFTF